MKLHSKLLFLDEVEAPPSKPASKPKQKPMGGVSMFGGGNYNCQSH